MMSRRSDTMAPARPVERLRERIRAEVERARPHEESRRALELIVETSTRAEETPEGLRIIVLDEHGRPRTVLRDGREDEVTLADLVEELRAQHPRLFAAPAAAGPETARTPAGAGPQPMPGTPGGPPEHLPTVPADRHARDLLILGSDEAEPVRAPPPERRARFAAPDWLRSGPRAIRGALSPALRAGIARLSSFRRPVRQAIPGASALADLPIARRRFGGRAALIVAAVVIAVPLLGVLGASVVNDVSAPPPREARAPQAEPAAKATAERPTAADADTTGTVQGQDPVPAGAAAGTLRGVPEVLDTATLSVQGTVIRLFGVEWARGAGDPDDLASYLGGREVVCRPQGDTDRHRCELEGRDLSRVVLYNGGGRATPDATPELKAAEEHARGQRIGVWGAESVRAQP